MMMMRRAASCNDREAIALHRLANLHSELGQNQEAAFYYKKDLERMEEEEREGPNMVEALLFLANYCRAQERYEEAEVYCTRLLDYKARGYGDGPSRDDDPPRRRHVIVLPRMIHPTKLEGMEDGPR
ncbi:putative tetratricopeptide-like helical domain superfamily [Helianthus annuus]|nr:putative tetratricopeptide-like helical domain superfamily [Helianthus annuus]